MSMCRVFSCVVGRGCLLWPVCSLGKTLLAFALIHSLFQGQIYLLPQVFLDFLLLHSSPLKWKGHLFWMLVLNGLGGRHRTVQLQLLPFSHPQIPYLNELIFTCFPPYFTSVFPFIFILNVWSMKTKETGWINVRDSFFKFLLHSNNSYFSCIGGRRSQPASVVNCLSLFTFAPVHTNHPLITTS